MKNKVHYNKPCGSIGLTCCLCRALAKGSEKEVGVCILYKDATLKLLLAALGLKDLSVIVHYLCIVSMEWNSYKNVRFHAFKVIQELMWMNLERLQRDYKGSEDGRSKHFRNTGNTAIIHVVPSLTHGIQTSKERYYCSNTH